MFIAARGQIVEDNDFAAFLGHCWRYQDDGCLMMVETIAKAGYGLCFVQPHVVYMVDEHASLGYDKTKEGSSPLHTEVNDTTTMDEFIQQCDTYGAYKSMDNLDFVLDILDRCDPHRDDPEDTHQAHQEIRRLVLEAIQWIEMTTEGSDPPDEADDLFYDGFDEEGGDGYER